MPLIKNSDYSPPFLLKNNHLQTIIPSLLRKVKDFRYTRERVELPDQDFIDLDWSKTNSDKLILVCHGLEGSSDSGYVKGLIKSFNEEGWDGVAMNFRGCSGEPNRLLRAYHSGETQDLFFILAHIMASDQYKTIVLAGFSLGGNVVLKFVGERGHILASEIKAAVAVSVPCDLTSSSYKLAKRSNLIYMKRFLRRLRVKVEVKSDLLPEGMDLKEFKKMQNFQQFDDRFTAPVHGFENAHDYWKKSSSKQFLKNIKIPTLLINAKDDPFLTVECFPVEEAEGNDNFYLEVPDFGGHVGFIEHIKKGTYWHEKRIKNFVKEKVN